MAEDKTIQFYAKLESPSLRVDREQGIIRGVSVITGNLTAIGHDLDVDDTTLRQVELEGREKKKVPVKINHKTGVDAVCGHLINFRREQGTHKVLADWKLLKSHPSYNVILETAEEQPETVGLSVSFKGPDAPVIIGGRAKARCVQLLSTDYVIHPAANPGGLFQAKVDSQPKGTMAQDNNTPNPEPTIADVLAAIQGLTKTVQEQGEFINSLQSERAAQEAYEIAGLTDEQAAELGIDAEDLQAAQQFIAENFGEEALAQVQEQTQAEIAGADGADGQGDGQGGDGADGADGKAAAAASAAAAPATAMSAKLASLEKVVTNLTSKLEKAELQAEKDAIDAEFDQVQQRLTELEQHEKRVVELEAENKKLVQALRGAGTRAVSVNFSAAGVVSNEDETAFESRVAKRVTELTAKDSNLSERSARVRAWGELIAQDPEGYQQFRARNRGVTTL